VLEEVAVWVVDVEVLETEFALALAFAIATSSWLISDCREVFDATFSFRV
jgi:hypothetical protein